MIRSFFEILGMAAVAFCRHSEAIELPHRSHLVAGIAVHHGMRSDQWKTVLVFVDVMNRDLPAIGVVAELALRSILPAMEIGMTVLALVGSVGEVEIRVAVATGDGGVAAAKGKSRLCMIESDLVLDHLPVGGGVTGDARNVQVAMRVLR